MRSKTKKFQQIALLEHVIEPGKDLFEQTKGHWNELVFEHAAPITLELACGRGEYTVGLSRIYPDHNFVGIDVKGDRIWKGSLIVEREGLKNAAFLRAQVHHLQDHFEPQEIGDIWLVFPDPRPKDRDEKRRLSSPRFIDTYKALLGTDGWFRFKTDNTVLFDYTMDILAARTDVVDLEFTRDLYASGLLAEHHGIRTRYEEKHHGLGETIKYLKCRFKVG